MGDVPVMNKYLIGNRIREAREIKRLTQEKLAELVDLSQNAISNIESGRACPSLKTIVAIASELDISIDNLLAPEQTEKKKMYIHEIIVKLNSMEEYELKNINKYFRLWDELHEKDIHKP